MAPGSRTGARDSQTDRVEAVHLSHPDDPWLDRVRVLRSPDRVLRSLGLVVMEGFTMVERWLRCGRTLRQLVVTPTQWSRLQALVNHLENPMVVTVVDQGVLSAAAGFDVHRGVLGFIDEPTPPPWDTVANTARTLMVAEGVNDAENLGAMMRSAWALGADAMVLDPTTLDPFGRRVVRVSMGAALELPVVRATSWPHALEDLQQRGVQMVALTPRSDAIPLGSWSVPTHQRVAVMVGAEGPGLSQAALERVETAVRIPMRPSVDSLNVAHAAAIALATLHRAPTMPP
jgi:tRNA G18 (ribose-2'-O)-methylase SpoU